MEPEETYQTKKKERELSALADAFLRTHGFGIWGEDKDKDTYRQSKFEAHMRTGAYSRNGEKRRNIKD